MRFRLTLQTDKEAFGNVLPFSYQYELSAFTFYGKPYEDTGNFAFEVTSRPKPKLITIKAGTPEVSNIRGFMFDFRMEVPVELMEIAYGAGIGGKNSTGFGMIEMK